MPCKYGNKCNLDLQMGRRGSSTNKIHFSFLSGFNKSVNKSNNHFTAVVPLPYVVAYLVFSPCVSWCCWWCFCHRVRIWVKGVFFNDCRIEGLRYQSMRRAGLGVVCFNPEPTFCHNSLKYCSASVCHVRRK